MNENAGASGKSYNHLSSGVLGIANKEDPTRLVERRVLASEYDPEITAIVPKLRSCRTVESLESVIHAVFVEWFGAEVAGPRERYRSIAEQIKALKDMP